MCNARKDVFSLHTVYIFLDQYQQPSSYSYIRLSAVGEISRKLGSGMKTLFL